ncbi:MAG: hypothetical protein INF92_15320 [Rhodobacter sp.]|nr:hypothetical protein [Rhodobacter sp.]
MAYDSHFKQEIPELQPRHVARFYATLYNSKGRMPFADVPGEWGFGFYPKFPEWKRPSAYRRDIALPAGVGPLWYHEEIVAPPQAFAPFVSDIRVDHDSLIPLIPDITMERGLGLVSERAMQLLEGVFPGGSYFWPVTIRSKDGTPIDRPYFRWVQRQQVTFDVDAANAMERATGQKLPRTTVFSESFNAVPDRRGRYDILHNEALRTVLDGIPFWTGDLCCSSPVYRAETFRALKAAGLTGLREVRKTEDEYDHKRGEYIGVIP